jgi:hypothetical protein
VSFGEVDTRRSRRAELEGFVGHCMNASGWDVDPSLPLTDRLRATRNHVVGWRWGSSNIAIRQRVLDKYHIEIPEDELDRVATGDQLVSLLIDKMVPPS